MQRRNFLKITGHIALASAALFATGCKAQEVPEQAAPVQDKSIQEKPVEVAPVVKPPEDMQLFLLIGQSNMAGRGYPEAQDKTTDPGIFMMNKEMQWTLAKDPIHFDKSVAGVGPGHQFARTLKKDEPNANIGLIPAAMGGSSLNQWKPGGELYKNAVARAKEAMKHGKLKGILWHQGEADGKPDKIASYPQRFSVMIAQLRKDLDAPEVPVVIGELVYTRDASAAFKQNDSNYRRRRAQLRLGFRRRFDRPWRQTAFFRCKRAHAGGALCGEVFGIGKSRENQIEINVWSASVRTRNRLHGRTSNFLNSRLPMMNEFSILPWEHRGSDAPTVAHAQYELEIGGRERQFLLKMREGVIYFKSCKSAPMWAVTRVFESDLVGDELIETWRAEVARENYGRYLVYRPFLFDLKTRSGGVQTAIGIVHRADYSGWAREWFDEIWLDVPAHRDGKTLDIWGNQFEKATRRTLHHTHREFLDRALPESARHKFETHWVRGNEAELQRVFALAQRLFVRDDDLARVPTRAQWAFHGVQSGDCGRLGHAGAEFSLQQAVALCAHLERSAQIDGAAICAGRHELETHRKKCCAQRLRSGATRKMGRGLARRLGHRNAGHPARSQTTGASLRPRTPRRFARNTRLVTRQNVAAPNCQLAK